VSWSVDIDFDMTGSPLLDGTAETIIDRWLDDVADSFARQGLAELHVWMDRFFRNPTPYYETQVTIDRVGSDRVIHDRGIIYGPWLAGTGSRNQTSRFKGYTHWRRTVQYLEQDEGPRIIDRHLPELLRRLGG
jgi:hypothetical protein